MAEINKSQSWLHSLRRNQTVQNSLKTQNPIKKPLIKNKDGENKLKKWLFERQK